jgi:hypothetical protein
MAYGPIVSPMMMGRMSTAAVVLVVSLALALPGTSSAQERPAHLAFTPCADARAGLHPHHPKLGDTMYAEIKVFDCAGVRETVRVIWTLRRPTCLPDQRGHHRIRLRPGEPYVATLIFTAACPGIYRFKVEARHDRTMLDRASHRVRCCQGSLDPTSSHLPVRSAPRFVGPVVGYARQD